MKAVTDARRSQVGRIAGISLALLCVLALVAEVLAVIALGKLRFAFKLLRIVARYRADALVDVSLQFFLDAFRFVAGHCSLRMRVWNARRGLRDCTRRRHWSLGAYAVPSELQRKHRCANGHADDAYNLYPRKRLFAENAS